MRYPTVSKPPMGVLKQAPDILIIRSPDTRAILDDRGQCLSDCNLIAWPDILNHDDSWCYVVDTYTKSLFGGYLDNGLYYGRPCDSITAQEFDNTLANLS